MNNNVPAVTNANENNFSAKLKKFFLFICSNSIKISRSKPIFSVPIIAAILVVLILWELTIPAVLISLFCGVEYTLEGDDISEPKTLTFKPNKD